MSPPRNQPGAFDLDAATISWLTEAADGLDTGTTPASRLMPKLAEAGLTRIGILPEFGGAGGTVGDAVRAIAAVSSYSLAAGFVLWGHRTYTDYLLRSDNAALRDELLPDLLSGRVAGATGLSNAMKFLAGLEELQIEARSEGDTLLLDGKMPWVTNLATDGFHVAGAVSVRGGGAIIVSFSHSDEGVNRSPDLDLIGLRSTNTAAIAIVGARLGSQRIIATDALAWLPRMRPAFLGLQCGMSIGLARRALAAARDGVGPGRHILAPHLAELADTLDRQETALLDGLASDTYVTNPADLFRLRIGLAESVAAAVGLELQASGGRAYIAGPGRGFARRLRESAFIPVVTPSLVQLKTMLDAQAASKAGVSP